MVRKAPARWANRWPEALPKIGEFVASYKKATKPKIGRIVAVFAAAEAWKRRIQAPSLLVQWNPGEKIAPYHGRMFDDHCAAYRTLRVLRPATKAEIDAWYRLPAPPPKPKKRKRTLFHP